jgi:hypothetical protein
LIFLLGLRRVGLAPDAALCRFALSIGRLAVVPPPTN